MDAWMVAGAAVLAAVVVAALVAALVLGAPVLAARIARLAVRLRQRLHASLRRAPRQYRYRRPGAPPQGVADLTRLCAMLADGRLEGDALVAAVGSDDWRPLLSMLDAGPAGLSITRSRAGGPSHESR